ncbi:MOSC domain-containing protein [Actinomadura macra]|uniref:MOSC domain-containing protein n=1 Tax=Actinomadura macra TaxID=46164 RepID=UPI000832D60F|nr:MOSC N-terminal beta barrel domain-containing protein [Actinomadura macra]
MPATLTELNVYPLKSGRGTSLTSAELTARGLRYDREFMLVTPEGRFLSQRELAPMALMRPSYDGTVLTVNAPGMAPLVHKVVDDGPVLDVIIHRHDCQGIGQGDEADAWFSALLDRDCRLVRFTGRRATSQGDELMFADRYPLLVISAESLADLNGRLDEPLPMNRFRPNLVIEGLGAYAEDSVRLLRVGETVIELLKACSRCVLTTTDQDTGERGREPLRTLATYRTIDQGIMFGQNGTPRTPGPLALGDPVDILEAT